MDRVRPSCHSIVGSLLTSVLVFRRSEASTARRPVPSRPRRRAAFVLSALSLHQPSPSALVFRHSLHTRRLDTPISFRPSSSRLARLASTSSTPPKMALEGGSFPTPHLEATLFLPCPPSVANRSDLTKSLFLCRCFTSPLQTGGSGRGGERVDVVVEQACLIMGRAIQRCSALEYLGRLERAGVWSLATGPRLVLRLREPSSALQCIDKPDMAPGTGRTRAPS